MAVVETRQDALTPQRKTAIEQEFRSPLSPRSPNVAASAHKGRFWFLFLLFIALAGVGYNRYRKIMKSHLL